jgi:hypothetical protein
MSKLIHQIYISDNNNAPSEYIISQMSKLQLLYSDYQYNLYNNEKCREEIKNALGGKAVSLYDSLQPYAFKADFARYVLLYVYGGYYYDVSLCPEEKFEFNDNAVLYEGIVSQIETNGYRLIENNFMFFKQPKDENLDQLINLVLHNISINNYGAHPLDITGPIALGRINFSDVTFGSVKRISETQKGSFFGDTLHLKHKPREYQASLEKLGCSGTNNYEKMWFDKMVFNKENNL